ncbi:GntR family transcriptional regulator [Dongia sedimenti]|uniref:GntR family transcriptional regulator n=1 Tax=Dongia sedimenti TaxID=3064282 RepID=A0ABU0YPV5_9PROT|nr:GntR family transcriptional regulator [Rhodospirillaceae bacterium R-7]
MTEATLQRTAAGPLARDSLSAQIYDGIRSKLMTGALEPGERLNIRRLADAFATSPTPVREAVMQLVREGALELRPGHELRVPVLSIDRYIKLRQVRAPLERLAAELAAPIISAASLQALDDINRDYMGAERKKRWKDALALHAEFHLTIYRASRNEFLINTIENLWLLSGPFLLNQYPSAIHPHDDQHPHLLVIEALRRRDAKQAGEVIWQGLDHGSALIVDKLKREADGRNESTDRR